MEDAQLVLVAFPVMGHLVAEVELSRRLVARDPRLSVAIFIPRFPKHDDKLDSYLRSLTSDPSVESRRISLVQLPALENLPDRRSQSFIFHLLEAYKPIVKRVVHERAGQSSPRLAGFLLDFFCTAFIDIAHELHVPSYLFSTSGAASLRMAYHFESVDVDVGDQPGEAAVEFSGVKNPVPMNAWPRFFLDKEKIYQFSRLVTRSRETNGILMNTFMELEFDFIHSLSKCDGVPPIHPVGPILDLDRPNRSDDNHSGDATFEWLDKQPPSSVVFLCFGSMASFGRKQIEQTAAGLEKCGHRFLWSLRVRPTPNDVTGAVDLPQDNERFDDILPEGFLDRTAGNGKVIGWAPQVAVLAHPAIGAFVSHCGWNSTLESVWFGVPIAAWPMYAEQHLNAYLLKELGMAAEVSMDYEWDFKSMEENMVVGAAEVEKGIRKIMYGEEGAVARKKVKEMSEKARAALVEGGSSYDSLGRFVEGIFKNLS